MTNQVFSAINIGTKGQIVKVECSLNNGLPLTHIIGLASKAVEESKVRLRSAFKNASIDYPKKKVVINLAPASQPKNDSGLDLAIASAIMLAPKTGYVADFLALGEVGLDGSIKPTTGCIGKLQAATAAGISIALVPTANSTEASLVRGISCVPISDIGQLSKYLNGLKIKPLPSLTLKQSTPQTYAVDLVSGHAVAKRALQISLAGSHNLHFFGPPGCGKSMLLKDCNQLLPDLNGQKLNKLLNIRSLTGYSGDTTSTHPPLIKPHHSISLAKMLGGPRSGPGKMALATGGLLVLDELAEFKYEVLESLREPLQPVNPQDRPNFVLMATSNPCPCGYYGSSQGNLCSCPGYQLARYKKRLSGALMDRIDINLGLEAHDGNIFDRKSGSLDLTGASIRASINRVHQIKNKNLYVINDIKKLKKDRLITRSAFSTLKDAQINLNISNRWIIKAANVAQTIALLDKRQTINQSDVAEALQYRYQNN